MNNTLKNRIKVLALKTIFITLPLGGVGGGLLFLSSCSSKKSNSATEVAEDPEVKVAIVKSESLPQTETYTATVESDVKNNISPNVAYRIEKILVDVGDRVSKGQCIVQLDASSLDQLKLNIANQKAVLMNTETDFNRTEQLYKVGGISKAEYDNAKVSLRTQQTQLNVLKSQLAQMAKNTALYAPISGYVTARNYDNGDMYSGTPILTIEQTNPVKVLIGISETHYKQIHVGMGITIEVDAYNDQKFQGKVTRIYPSIDTTTHTFQVEVTIHNPNEKVRPGMFARAIVNYGNLNHVVVPDEALVKQIGAGDRYVYVYDPQTKKVSYNKVELGKHMGNKYEIMSGVQDGSQVVIAGQSRLNDGKKVKVVK